MRQKPPSAPIPLLALTPGQTCEALQIGRDQFNEWSRRPGFPVIRDGKTILVPIDSLKEWLREQAAETNLAPMPSLTEQFLRAPIPPSADFSGPRRKQEARR